MWPLRKNAVSVDWNRHAGDQGQIPEHHVVLVVLASVAELDAEMGPTNLQPLMPQLREDNREHLYVVIGVLEGVRVRDCHKQLATMCDGSIDVEARPL